MSFIYEAINGFIYFYPSPSVRCIMLGSYQMCLGENNAFAIPVNIGAEKDGCG